jgi:hypothetical protein
VPQLNIYLEGGPDGLAEYALPLAPTAEIKIPIVAATSTSPRHHGFAVPR